MMRLRLFAKQDSTTRCQALDLQDAVYFRLTPCHALLLVFLVA